MLGREVLMISRDHETWRAVSLDGRPDVLEQSPHLGLPTFNRGEKSAHGTRIVRIPREALYSGDLEREGLGGGVGWVRRARSQVSPFAPGTAGPQPPGIQELGQVIVSRVHRRILPSAQNR